MATTELTGAEEVAWDLSDLYESPNLTMTYATDTGETAGRTLGRGDILGARKLYG